MKPAQAKKILGCSYTTLHNYVKQGKLKLAKNNLSDKHQEYDDASVYDLSTKIHGSRNMNNMVVIYRDNERFELKLNKMIIDKIIDVISYELKKENAFDEA